MKYDLILTGATVIDPSQGIEARKDVAVKDGIIAAVADSIDAVTAREQIDLSGQILTPGWVDIHAHVYAGATTWGIKADAHCLATGVTTIVDAGSSGWANFLGFKEFVADCARTQTLTFVHISGIGLTYGPLGEMVDLRYGDPERTACVVQNWPEICVGIKVRQAQFQVGDNGVEPLRLANVAADLAQVPVMVHIGSGVALPDVLAEMRSGDIVTHCYQGHGDLVIDGDDQILPEVWDARSRGVLFDVGHGGGSFNFGVARTALAQGFAADVISTDIHAHSIERTVNSLADAASKLMSLGVELSAVIERTTSAAAAAIGRGDELGTLRVGTVADLAAFDIVEGEFDFHDCHGQTNAGSYRIEPALTVRAGTPYRPDDLREEVEETLRRAREMNALSGGNFEYFRQR
jgi:dihydroorotase